ncbi:hypothetical protein IPM09_01315 [Candidatus Saccharibacteria bacterium]|nr:MAG: hypothetical protein IPM09_01315 [Candidatus Saccharibacteria bacterium]
MGRYIEQTESRSELQQKIAADLRAKAVAKAKQEGAAADAGYYAAPDGVDDSAYIKGTKTTTTLAPAWVIITFMAIAVFAFFVYQVNK